MCFEYESSPPIRRVAGGASGYRDLTLTASDGTGFAAFEAFAAEAKAAAVIVLPDVRGLYRFYEELALRISEAGYDSLAIDYFGRTAGIGKRGEDFEFREHVDQATFDGVTADVTAAIDHLREGEPGRKVFTVGSASVEAILGTKPRTGWTWRVRSASTVTPIGSPRRVRLLSSTGWGRWRARSWGSWVAMTRRPERRSTSVPRCPDGIRRAPRNHHLPGAPHSFFDRKYEEFAAESADAWDRVMAFFAENG